MLLIMALLASGFAVSSALRLRAEETSGRLENLLATGLSRTRWLLGSLVVTVLGTVLLVAVAGFGMGLAYGLVLGDASQPWRLAGLALVYAPAAVCSPPSRCCWSAGRPARRASPGPPSASASCSAGWAGCSTRRRG